MRRLLIIASMGSVALLGQTNTGSAPATGSIQRTVADASTNKPIAGAVVAAISTGSPWFGQSAPSGGAGTFRLCAWVAYQSYFDPCLPGAGVKPVSVALTGGQQSTGNQISLTTVNNTHGNRQSNGYFYIDIANSCPVNGTVALIDGNGNTIPPNSSGAYLLGSSALLQCSSPGIGVVPSCNSAGQNATISSAAHGHFRALTHVEELS